MEITLRKINEDNWRECIALKVSKDQSGFVATNENGLALAYAHKEMQPRAIYAGDIMVGFIMYAKDPDDGLFYINRFMIDEKFQKKGYGEKALANLLEELKKEGVKSVDILHKPYNEVAIKVYKRLGFNLTDEKLGDDVISTAIL